MPGGEGKRLLLSLPDSSAPPHHSTSVDTTHTGDAAFLPPGKRTLHTTQLCVLSQRNE